MKKKQTFGFLFISIFVLSLAVVPSVGHADYYSGGCLDLQTNMKHGDQNNTEINTLQEYLGVYPSGVFDNSTYSAVRAFQLGMGLPAYVYGATSEGPFADGIVGPVTREKIRAVSCGSDAVTPTLPPNDTNTATCPNGNTIESNCVVVPTSVSQTLCPNGNTIVSNCQTAPTSTPQTETKIKPTLISSDVTVVDASDATNTLSQANGVFKFSIFSPYDDIRLNRSNISRSMRVSMAGTGDIGNPTSSTLTATSGNSNYDSMNYFTVREGETRTFELSFIIPPTNGSGYYRVRLSSISVDFPTEKGVINFGSEFITRYVSLRGQAATIETKVTPILINAKTNIVDTSDATHKSSVADGSFTFSISAQSNDIRFYTNDIGKSVRVLKTGTGDIGNPTAANIAATSDSSYDGADYFTIKRGETRRFELRFYIEPGDNTKGYYGAKLTSLHSVDENVSIEFGSEFVAPSVYLSGKEVATPQPSVTVTSPWSGGEKVTAGSSYTVRWNSSNIPVTNDMKVFISSEAKGYSQMINNGPNTGYLPITVPSQLSGDYEFVVQTTINGNVYSGSSSASIIPSVSNDNPSGNPVDETLKNNIISLYKKYLAREPDTKVLQYYFDHSTTLDQIKDIIISSQEYQDRREAIRQVYLELLKREPDADGWTYWSDNGYTVDDMRSRTLNGYEYGVKKQITDLYTQLLNRQPDDQGLGYYYNRIYLDHWTITKVRDSIIQSVECGNSTYCQSKVQELGLGASAIYALPGMCSIPFLGFITGQSCN